MTYRLKFLPVALKEWEKLGEPVKTQFKKKLAARLENPRVPTDRLSGYESVYKIKLRAAGYRLVYEVVDDTLIVYVLAVGKRDKGRIYAVLKGRL
ncbi:type II toxin-antitoxin system RelE family toxin [Ectothiorhodospira mobilis]|jgi:mRNA interferase RelE/StbE|uniref:type II toxin-antitoxin system RelE family toxin n=1 Tax=Ectothiorhodospira mobilis TaxID=195064 RepID=UPI001EE78DB0|nr:type II toxin-antitoxin system RelE/ParE family toxin [Ectothiorhodospira mobilis]MCG5536080.1 type II toxin-antitoxin system RelE/ParE family toxin [Ectothiorhodospira mobilis]